MTKTLERIVEEQIDSYTRTVEALRAITNELLFDDKTRKLASKADVSSGRKFRTSKANRISPDTNITPDLAFTNLIDYSAVVEAKLGFPPDKTREYKKRIVEVADQINKYDDDLKGWATKDCLLGKLGEHDLVLIINHEDAKRVISDVEQLIASGTLKPDRMLSIFSIAISQRVDGGWPTISLDFGNIKNANKNSKLKRSAIPINPSILAANPFVGSARFYDNDPPVPLLMATIHEAVVESILSTDDREQLHIEGRTEVAIDIKSILNALEIYCFPRKTPKDAVVPTKKAIREAFALFVKCNWASRGAETDEIIYEINKLKKGFKDPQSRFIDVYVKDQSERQARAERKELKRIEKDKKKYPLFIKDEE